jgi:hypothetical protein
VGENEATNERPEPPDDDVDVGDIDKFHLLHHLPKLCTILTSNFGLIPKRRPSRTVGGDGLDNFPIVRRRGMYYRLGRRHSESQYSISALLVSLVGCSKRPH